MEPLPPLTQQVPPVSPPSVIPAKHHSLVGGIAIALGAGLAITAGFLLFNNYFPTGEEAVPTVSATPDPTAGWKTYREGSFEIKYPENFSVSFGGMDSLSGEIKDFEWNKNGYSYPYIKYPQETRFYMQVQSITTAGSSIEEWLIKNTEKVQILNEYKPLDGVLISERSITISGLLGTQRVMRYQGNSGTIDIILSYVSRGSQGYRIVGHSITPKNIDLYTQILSTFKFIEPTTVVPADWKTYTNAQYGFEVKYPPTWRWAVEGIQSGGTLLGFDTGVYGDDASIAIELSGKNTGLSANQIQHNGYLFTFNGNRIDQIRPTFKFTVESTVCTADAMRCPDGSYVGRTGPNCQFVCP